MEAYERLKAVVLEAEGDIMKAERGNKAAGTRVRKTMQEIKKIAQELRGSILEMRGAPEEGGCCGGEKPGCCSEPPPAE